MEKISPKVPLYPVLPSAYFYEQEIWSQQKFLCGIDEVGRGCLAGPVVTCALILHPHVTHPLLRDSKVLSEKQRNTAALWIANNAWYAFGMVNHQGIDTHNIYQATLLAMKKAYYGLVTKPEIPERPSLILVDAMPLKVSNGPEIMSFTQGESKSVSIAAASIMAKVMRDALMQRYEKLFPGYALHSNKGYGAEVHRTGLHTRGMSLIHRKTFLSSFIKEKDHEHKNGQTSLFC